MVQFRLLIFIALLGFSGIALAQENFLVNGQFDDEVPVWFLNNNSGGDGVFTIDNNSELSGENSAKIELNGTGDNDYNIQFVQEVIPVEEAGYYYLSFMAKVEEDVIMTLSWEENGGAWTRYGTTTFTLVEDQRHYAYEFESAASDETANVKFFLGDAANVGLTVFLDSIVLSDDPYLYGEITSIDNTKIESANVKLYPNPANDYITVSYQLTKEQDVSIDLFNISGQKERTFYSGNMNSGSFNTQLNLSGLQCGIYFMHLTSNEFSSIKKLIIE